MRTSFETRPDLAGHLRHTIVRAARRQDTAGRLAGWSATDLRALADGLARYNASIEASPGQE